MNVEQQRHVVTPLIQSAYNLTFNPALRGGSVREDGKQLEDGVILHPNGLDVTLHGMTKAIRWELLENNKVANVTYVPQAYFDHAFEVLTRYLHGTE